MLILAVFNLQSDKLDFRNKYYLMYVYHDMDRSSPELFQFSCNHISFTNSNNFRLTIYLTSLTDVMCFNGPDIMSVS